MEPHFGELLALWICTETDQGTECVQVKWIQHVSYLNPPPPSPPFQNSRSNTAICLHDGVASNVIEAHCRHGSKFWISSVFSVTCRKRNVFSSLHIACMVFKEVNETGQQVHLWEIVQCVQDVDSVVRGLWRAWQNTYYKSAIPVLCLLISIIGQLLPT